MVEPRQKNIVERLADAGEEAIQKLGGAAGADKVMSRLVTLKDRVDELQKSVRTIDRLERRLSAMERRLDKLEGKSPSTSRKTSGPNSEKKAAARKPGADS
jgi:hypothetical protein